MQLHILADEADFHGSGLVVDALHQRPPFRQVRRRRVDAQLPAGDAGQVRLLQHQRRFVEVRQRAVFDHAVGLDVAEVGDLGEDAPVGDWLVHPQHDDVRRDAHALELLHGVLGGLRLVFAAGLQVRHQRHVDVQRVLTAHLQPHLADGLDEGLGFDVADGAADLGDHHVGVGLLAHLIDKRLDLVGDVGDGLDGASQIPAPPLPLNDVGIDLSRGQVRELVQVLVDEALVVAQVQVGLRAVLGDVHLAVLIGAHGAGVHVDVGVQLLGGHHQAPGLQEPPQGRRRDALAQAGHHAAGDKDVFRQCISPFQKRVNLHRRRPSVRQSAHHQRLARAHVAR